jgi:hypothetical protein
MQFIGAEGYLNGQRLELSVIFENGFRVGQILALVIRQQIRKPTGTAETVATVERDVWRQKIAHISRQPRSVVGDKWTNYVITEHNYTRRGPTLEVVNISTVIEFVILTSLLYDSDVVKAKRK